MTEIKTDPTDIWFNLINDLHQLPNSIHLDMNEAQFQRKYTAISELIKAEDFYSSHQQARELRIHLSSEHNMSSQQFSQCIFLELQALFALKEWDGFVEMMDEYKANLSELNKANDLLIKTQMMTALAEIGRGTEIPEWGLTLCAQYLNENNIECVQTCVTQTRNLLEQSQHGFLISGFEQAVARKLPQIENKVVKDQLSSFILNSKTD